jgi:crossover junction endodeoxyribonuclease RuvC
MRVLGIDCGTERTGYGVIDSDGRAHRMIAAGVIRTAAKSPLELRLQEISRELRGVIVRYSPGAAAVEEVFFSANARTALKLAHVRGVALLAISEAGLEFGEYSPLEVKSSVVGYGRAEKCQVQLMVRSLLRLEGDGADGDATASEDACDALAVAICHATHAVTQRRIARVQR